MKKRYVAKGFTIMLLLVAMLFFLQQAIAESWFEIDDAGQLIDNSQVTVGSGTLDSIHGALATGLDDVDLYQIFIVDTTTFSVTVTASLSVFNDAKLFLFNSEGFLVLDDDDGGFIFLPQFNAGELTGNPVGLYYLAFVLFGTDPVDYPLTGWDSKLTYEQTGTYTLSLTGARFAVQILTDVTSISQIDKFGTRFDRRTGQFSMMATWKNIGTDSYFEPLQLVIENITPNTITCANADGTTVDGKPYYDYSSLVGDGKLDPGETSEAKPLVFNNPTRVRFEFDVRCWANR
jgi:hypothetical protein